MIEPDRTHFKLADTPPDAANAVSIGVISLEDRQTIASLAGEWQALYARAGTPYSLFQSHEWCRAWLDANPGVDIRIACRRDNGRLSAVLPLMFKRVAGLGIAMQMGGMSAEYVEVLAQGVAQGEFIGQVEAALRSAGLADVLTIDGLVACDGLDAALCRESDTGPSFVCDVSKFEDHSAYLGSRSSNTRSNIKRNWKKLRERGDVCIEAGMPTQERLAELYPVLAKWKREWLYNNGIAGAAYDEAALGSVFASLTGEEERVAGLRATIISLDGQVVTANLYLADNKVLHCIGVYRDMSVQGVSLGVLMQDATVTYALANGFDRIDYGLGENEDKKRNSTLIVPRYVYSRALTPRGRFAAAVGLTSLRNAVKTGFYKLPLSARQQLMKLRG